MNRLTRRVTYEEMMSTVQAFALQNYGQLPRRLRIELVSGTVEDMGCPAWPLPTAPTVNGGAERLQDVTDEDERDDDQFIPGDLQELILEALDGVAMKTGDLKRSLPSKARLFQKPGGIQELRDKGLVKHHQRLGYYRPDAPPEVLAKKDAEE